MSDTVREKHNYEPAVMREFKSTIPPHLLANLPEDERFMVETMSKLENQYGWLAEVAVRNNQATLDLDGRVTVVEGEQAKTRVQLAALDDQKEKVDKLWDWKQYFSGKWAIIAAIGLLIFMWLFELLKDYATKALKP